MMAATVMAVAATVASPVKAVAPMDKPVVKAADHAVKAVATDAIAVADAAADVVATVNAKVAHNANVLTPKANRCRWTPTRKWVVKTHPARMPIARNHALSAHRANVVNAAAVVAVVVNAMKMASATSPCEQKAVTSQAPTPVPTTPPATRAVSPARAVVVMAAKAAVEAAVVAMAVVPAQRVTHAMPTVKTPNGPQQILRMQTRRPLP